MPEHNGQIVTGGEQKRRDFIKGAVASSALLGLAGCVGGDGDDGDFPSKSMHYIIPFGEGGGADVYARNLGPVWADKLGVDVQYENIPGAGGLQGAGELMQSDPDGYTVAGFQPPLVNTSAYENPPGFDITDLQGVSLFGISPSAIIAHESLEIEGYEDLAERYQSGELDHIGGTTGSQTMMISLPLLKDNFGLEFDEAIGYDGSGPTNQGVLSEEVPAAVVSDAGGASAVEDDAEAVVSLATMRSEIFPDTQSIIEVFEDDEDAETIANVSQLNRGIWTTPDTPKDRIDVLSDAMKEAIETDEVQEWSNESGNMVTHEGPDEADRIMNDMMDLVEEYA